MCKDVFSLKATCYLSSADNSFIMSPPHLHTPHVTGYLDAQQTRRISLRFFCGIFPAKVIQHTNLQLISLAIHQLLLLLDSLSTPWKWGIFLGVRTCTVISSKLLWLPIISNTHPHSPNLLMSVFTCADVEINPQPKGEVEMCCVCKWSCREKLAEKCRL